MVYLVMLGLFIGMASAAATDAKPLAQSSTIRVEQITPTAFESLTKFGQLRLIKQDDETYLPDRDDPSQDPCAGFKEWCQINCPYFQNMANSLCKPSEGAYGVGNCCILLMFLPQSPPCMKIPPIVYTESITAQMYTDG